MPAAVSPRALAALVALAGCDAEPAPLGPVEYAEDLAEDIPMTGAIDPRFAEVDTAMRQFVKWRCAGAGALAISYKGRRVYKRGFGRMHGRASETLYPGCGDDESNPYDPAAALTRPDSPLYIGSVSKPITAAVARWLIDEQLAARPGCGASPCPASAAEVRLLDPAQALLPAELAAVVGGEVPVPVPLADAPCTSGHDPKYADPRWREITVGNLISHRSGLPHDALGFAEASGVIGNLAALRGYVDGGEDPWLAEDAAVRAAHGAYGPAIDAAAAWLSARSEGAPVYFVRGHPDGAQRLDETIALSAGRCLLAAPGLAGAYEEDGLYDPIGQNGQYSNFAITIVGRIIDHLQQGRTGGAFLPDFGRPETHWNSALAEFLDVKLGIREGVETAEGILTRGSYYPYPGASPPPHPVPRIWKTDTYYPLGWEQKAPYCVYREGGCDFSAWLQARDGDVSLRPDLTWSLLGAEGFRRVPLWVEYYYINNAAGGFISELPVFLAFANKYNISGASSATDNGNGTERTAPLRRVQGHNGSLDGGFAIVQQLVGDTRLRSLPPLVDGHMVDDFDHLQQRLVTRPDGVDYVVAVNQNNDPRCTFRLGETCGTEYTMLASFVDHGLSQVDWKAVEQMVAAQRDEVVGMAVGDGVTHLWFADDHHVQWAGAPDSFPGRDEVFAAEPYALPSTRIGPDVVGVARDPAGRVVAWYDDGRFSVGDARDLADSAAPLPFAVAAGHDAGDVVAVSIAGDGVAYAWYADGSWSSGTMSDLAAEATGRFELPDGVVADDIEAIAFDVALPDVVWTRFGDGSVGIGSVTRPGG